jgi:hypothetical protein
VTLLERPLHGVTLVSTVKVALRARNGNTKCAP